MMRILAGNLLLACLITTHSFAASDNKRLPEPLSLSAALAIANEQNPEIMLAQAREQQAQAQRNAAQVSNNFQLRLDSSLGRREFNGHEEENNTAYLVLQKQLYDFNRTNLTIAATEAQFAAQNALASLAQNQYRQAVIDAYYAVLLADLTYRVENEQLAIEYVSLDNAKDEAKLGKFSALELLALEEPYQRTIIRRALAENAQRSTRAALAELLGYPNALPEELDIPDNSTLKKRALLDINVLQQQALERNFELQAAAQLLTSYELKLQSAEQMSMPCIDAIGRTGWHSHVDTLYEGRWRYDLTLTVPIMDGGLKASEVDKAKAELMRVRAQKLALERQVRQAVLETALQLATLKSRAGQIKVSGDYAEMILDKNRTEYQFERKADLGDSMVRATRVELELMKLERDRAVLWENLQNLVGEAR
jgi:outer membrane protein TolC